MILRLEEKSNWLGSLVMIGAAVLILLGALIWFAIAVLPLLIG